MYKPRIIIFASGSKDPEKGGSGFENLVSAQRAGILDANIVAVVSNHQNGSVRKRADRLGIPFEFFVKDYNPEQNHSLDQYRKFVSEYRAGWVVLSGWLKLVTNLNPTRTLNIHPGPLPQFGGDGMYGHHVHEKVMGAYNRGEPNPVDGQRITHSAVTMHFVTPIYDDGPVFFRFPVEIRPDDTADTLAKRVNAVEHEWQPKITNMVINGEISWDGVKGHPVVVPEAYQYL